MCKTWCLIGSCAKLEVAQSAAPSFQQHHLLPVVGDVADVLTRLSIVDHSPAGYVDVLVFAVGSVTLVLTAVAPVLSKHMTLVFQVEQCPVVVVSAQDDVASASTVSAVGATIVVILHMLQVHATPTALS